MNCIFCNAPLTSNDFCPDCGADVSLLKRVVRISNLLYNKGLEKASVRDLSGAVSLLKQSLKFNKENIDARNLLGLCYFETGEVVSALVEWVISKNMKPEDNLAGEYLRTLQTNKNRLDQIDATIRKYNQSIEYCREGHEDMAVMQLRRVITQNPKLVKAYQLLALLYMHESEWEKARRLLKKASSIDNTNTTTRRYLTAIEEETGKTSAFGIRRRLVSGGAEEEKSLRYVSGNETIIAPTTFRDSSTVATFINICLGILLGGAIVYFLTVPAVRQRESDRANKSVTDANTSLATISATVQDLEDDVENAKGQVEAANKERDDALRRIDGYDSLLEVADLYVQGDQTKTVDAIKELKAEDYDGKGKVLYEHLSSAVGGALFNQYFNAGTNAYVQGDYGTSAEQLQLAVDMDVSSSYYHDALYYLGFAYFNLGDYDHADDAFQLFMDRYPNEASKVQPYMNGGYGGSSSSSSVSSQGQASVDASGEEAVQDGTGQSSGSSQRVHIAWTDPNTGQGYDMYGNPVYQ